MRDEKYSIDNLNDRVTSFQLLSAAHIVDYYGLHFQIEFNFRDAKQHWGLEDFMNFSPQAVTNAVNFSQIILRSCRRNKDIHFSVLDLKNQFRAQRYLSETIKMLPEIPPPDLVSHIWRRLARFGGIRTRHSHTLAA